MITKIRLVNTSITSHTDFVCVCGKNFKIYFPGNIQIYSTILLTIVSMHYITSSDIFHLKIKICTI